MNAKLLMIHGGGPTAVINASLYGAIAEAKRHVGVEMLAAIGGTGGLFKGRFLDLLSIPKAQLELLPFTPGSAIGTSRDPLEEKDYRAMADIVKHHGFTHVLCTGGNGTMDMCGKLARACHSAGHGIRAVGIPKTVDNDLAVTDHSPGYGSAARYMATSIQEVCADVKSLPIHVVVVEALGRNAGWITAAGALAGQNGGFGPDLIYLPERPFVEAEFLEDVQALIQQKNGVVVVVSEGLTGLDGKSIVPPVYEVGRSVYYGDVSAHLAGLVIRKLGYKARSEKPGILGRSSITLQSTIDREEAQLAGEFACRAALSGESEKMVAFRRVSDAPYRMEPFLADIREVMLTERKMPDEYIASRGNGVTDDFLRWCAPLIGGELARMISFKDMKTING